MMVAVALLVLAAFDATAADLQPSALRVMVTAVVGLLATLFWPGSAETPARTALRVAAWSIAAAGLAAIALRLFGNPVQPLARILGACGMLLLILLLTHSVAAVLERHLRGRSGDGEGAREMAGRTVAVALALLGALPLWLGPLGELVSRRHAWVIDAVVGASPLTHLAVASGNDLLRNQWFYQHSNLAALQFSYPDLGQLAWSYTAACLVLALMAQAFAHRHRPTADANHTHLTTEKAR